MQLLDKTNKFFHDALQNLKSLFFEGYQKLTKPGALNPFSRGTSNAKNKNNKKNHSTVDQLYADFCNDLEYDLEKAMNNSLLVSRSEPMRNEDGVGHQSARNLASSPSRKKQDEKMSKRFSRVRKGEEENSSKEGGYSLAKKMKELEMMDVSDVEHVLDVEEALHYYSRLKSPVYLDIVDKFFTNMHTEFSVPHPSINNSNRSSSIRL